MSDEKQIEVVRIVTNSTPMQISSEPVVAACCSASAQETCCAPSEKSDCCGASASSGSCGCQ